MYNMYKETSWTFKNDRQRPGVLEGRYRRGKKKKNVFATLSGEKKKNPVLDNLRKTFSVVLCDASFEIVLFL